MSDAVSLLWYQAINNGDGGITMDVNNVLRIRPDDGFVIRVPLTQDDDGPRLCDADEFPTILFHDVLRMEEVLHSMDGEFLTVLLFKVYRDGDVLHFSEWPEYTVAEIAMMLNNGWMEKM